MKIWILMIQMIKKVEFGHHQLINSGGLLFSNGQRRYYITKSVDASVSVLEQLLPITLGLLSNRQRKCVLGLRKGCLCHVSYYQPQVLKSEGHSATLHGFTQWQMPVSLQAGSEPRTEFPIRTLDGTWTAGLLF